MRNAVELPGTLSLEEAARCSWEVVIVGAGPAGAAVALELARLGRSVLLIDKARFPRYKVCGCCLNGRTLGLLAALGLEDLPRRQGAVALGSVRIGSTGREVSLPLPGGVALSRASLDAALVAAAIDVGVAFLPRTEGRAGPLERSTRTLFLRDDRRICTVQTRLVVAADGLRSGLLREQRRGVSVAARGSRIGVGSLTDRAPSWYGSGCIYMACGAQGYIGLVRLEDDRLNVAAAFDVPFLKSAGGPGQAAARVLEEVSWPGLPGVADLDWHGTPALTRSAPRIAEERLFVLGDAAGYIEPFTGEGLGWALGMARALAPLATRAVCRWDPSCISEWERLYRSVVGARLLCRSTAWALRRAPLRWGCIKALALAPGLARPLIRQLHQCASSS